MVIESLEDKKLSFATPFSRIPTLEDSRDPVGPFRLEQLRYTRQSAIRTFSEVAETGMTSRAGSGRGVHDRSAWMIEEEMGTPLARLGAQTEADQVAVATFLGGALLERQLLTENGRLLGTWLAKTPESGSSPDYKFRVSLGAVRAGDGRVLIFVKALAQALAAKGNGPEDLSFERDDDLTRWIIKGLYERFIPVRIADFPTKMKLLRGMRGRCYHEDSGVVLRDLPPRSISFVDTAARLKRTRLPSS